MSINAGNAQLFKPVYRNRSHARLDFGDFQKEINTHLRSILPYHLQFKVSFSDHFLDRIMDRKADPRHIKKMIWDTLDKKICEILYFTVVEKPNPRMTFTDTIHYVMSSWVQHSKTLVFRTYVYNPNRFEGTSKEKDFVINHYH